MINLMDSFKNGRFREYSRLYPLALYYLLVRQILTLKIFFTMLRRALNSKNWDPRLEFSDNEVMDKRNIYLVRYIQVPNLAQGEILYDKYPRDIMMVLRRANRPICYLTFWHV